MLVVIIVLYTPEVVDPEAADQETDAAQSYQVIPVMEGSSGETGALAVQASAEIDASPQVSVTPVARLGVSSCKYCKIKLTEIVGSEWQSL